MSTEQSEHVTRIVDRLRRDHPDPKMREELYADGKLSEYVQSLMNGFDVDDAELANIVSAVRDAEDGQPGDHG
jgi:hypothetical protein